jgi:hypothetical protein
MMKTMVFSLSIVSVFIGAEKRKNSAIPGVPGRLISMMEDQMIRMRQMDQLVEY